VTKVLVVVCRCWRLCWTVAAEHLPAETTNVRQAANNVTQTHTYKPWEMGRMKLLIAAAMKLLMRSRRRY
jgi:hypothetical protein